MAKFVRILSIDGGGIRGIIPGQVLVSLEAKLQKKKGPDARIADYFDLVAGTSTGGILACVLLCPDDREQSAPRPRFTAQQAVDLYLNNGDEIFDIPFLHKLRSAGGVTDEKYPSDGIEETLLRYLGDLYLHELIKPTLITAYDIKNRVPFFFKQHHARNQDGTTNTGKNYFVRDAARATSAAPTFFEAARVISELGVPRPLVDGGVFANNPTLCAYAEARNNFSPHGKAASAKDMCILSLGTGTSPKAYSHKEAKDWGLAQWVKPLIDIMMSGVSETVDYQLNEIYDAVEKPEQYIRLQADLSREHDSVSEMDNAERENLLRLVEIGKDLADQKDDELNKLVEQITA